VPKLNFKLIVRVGAWMLGVWFLSWTLTQLGWLGVLVNTVLVAMAFGIIYMQEQRRVKRDKLALFLQHEVRNSLMVLRYSADDEARSKAVQRVVAALEENATVRRNAYHLIRRTSFPS
jgi:hypothetical protein